MRIFHDINEAYCELMGELHDGRASPEQTRNGPAFVWKDPQLFCYDQPEKRVLFDPERNANPFFHYMEAIWILAGSNDVNFPAAFASNMKTYSDDGKTLHGAYGRRWRHSWSMDQIDVAIKMLADDPTTRRVVLQMWDPQQDLGKDSKDLPCNTQVYLRVRDSELDITVMNRSNDLVYGMLGANFVSFSILQEYVARSLRLKVGQYYHFTNNLHVYEGFEGKFSGVVSPWYRNHPAPQRHQFSDQSLNLSESKDFVKNPDGQWKCPILRDNASPMAMAWMKYKSGDFMGAIALANTIYDDDWREACVQWLQRRLDEKG